MGRKKKREKLIAKAAEALRARGEASPQGRQTMNSETFRPEPAADPQGGTAAIHAVTPEMMDEAAHRAAATADGVAHHTIPLDAPRAAPSDASPASGPAAHDRAAHDADAPAAPAADTDAAAHGAIAEGAETGSTATEHTLSEVAWASPRNLAQFQRGKKQDRVGQPTQSCLGGDPGHAMVQAAAATGDALADMADVAAKAATEAGDAVARSARAGLPGGTDAFGQYNAKVLDMVRSNMASTTALFAALVQAKSVPEAMALNADHLRRQMDALTTQGRDLATIAQTMALDALQPFKPR